MMEGFSKFLFGEISFNLFYPQRISVLLAALCQPSWEKTQNKGVNHVKREAQFFGDYGDYDYFFDHGPPPPPRRPPPPPPPRRRRPRPRPHHHHEPYHPPAPRPRPRPRPHHHRPPPPPPPPVTAPPPPPPPPPREPDGYVAHTDSASVTIEVKRL